ncbi:MAG TPA: T9SS type A sorting domain-containing protein, partial [Bacteroidia bacterium]|nr:T9SS type A sorting domain-containing protein [Bacteroidia bacterium]
GSDAEINYEIINALGQVVKTGRVKAISGEKSEVSVSGLAQGVYSLKLTNNTVFVNYKFVKE